MGSQNELTQIREAFQIPDSILIRTLPITKIFPSNIGSTQEKFSIPNMYNIVDPSLYLSEIGTPVYTNIELLSETYETNVKGKFISTPQLRFDAILLTVSQAKKIIKTEIQGRNGSVKEYIGDDDYQVQINGVITGSNGHYPLERVSQLKQILDAPVAIPIASTYLNNLGIHSLVVESYQLDQDAGGYSYQKFSISCISDTPQELRLGNVALPPASAITPIDLRLP